MRRRRQRRSRAGPRYALGLAQHAVANDGSSIVKLGTEAQARVLQKSPSLLDLLTCFSRRVNVVLPMPIQLYEHVRQVESKGRHGAREVNGEQKVFNARVWHAYCALVSALSR
jgi:hypothetical protein